MIRTASRAVDFELCAEIYADVSPRGGITAEHIARSPGTTLLAGDDGFAYVDRSSIPAAAIAMVRVRPSSRGRGVGSALLDAARGEARDRGFERAWGRVYEPDDASMRFVTARGFAEVNRDVEVLLTVEPGDGAWTPGIVELREEHLPGAYEVAAEAMPEMALPQIAEAPPYEKWLERRARELAADFVALDGDDVVGYAALYHVGAQLENGLTAVRKSHRRRGLALALKRAEIAWAAEHGYRELVTDMVEANTAMRAVNEQLGYKQLPAWIVVEAAL